MQTLIGDGCFAMSKVSARFKNEKNIIRERIGYAINFETSWKLFCDLLNNICDTWRKGFPIIWPVASALNLDQQGYFR